MKRTSRLLGIHLAVLFIFTVATVTLRTVACLTELNYVSGYFGDKLLISIANWLAVFACLIGGVYLIIEKRGMKYKASFDNALTYIPSGVVSVALVFLSATNIYDIVKLPGKFWSADTFSDINSVFTFAIAAFALVSVVYFLLSGLIEKSNASERGAFGLALTVFLALYASYLYFKTDIPLNSPTKIVDQLAYASAAAFFLFETRISLDRGKWNAYAAFGYIAALLTAYSAIPSLIVYFVKGEVISSSIAESVLTLALFIFICCRLVLLLRLPEDTKCGTAEAISLMAEARINEIAESRLTYARDYISNEENDDPVDEESDEDDSNYTIDIDGINSENDSTDGD